MSYDEPKRRKQPSAILIGVVVGLLVLALGGASLLLAGQFRQGAAADRSTRTPASGPPSGRAGAMPSTDPALARFYGQSLHWTGCDSGNLCAWMTVPLDYAQPDGQTIRIKVVDVPAQGQAVGSLVVNPGGPGGSGIQYAEAGSFSWPDPIRRNFNLIGFDPRGVGQSTPLRCMDTQQTDAYISADPDPDTTAARAAMDRATRAFGKGCLADSGQLARHMSTVEVAKDMDILRQLLKEPKLTYFGASYGTFIGATYAGLFPTHVGRMVLDGAIDPALSNAQITLAQAHGFETALRAYVADCVGKGGCILGDSVTAGTAKIHQVIADLETHPIKTSSGRMLTAGNGVLGVFMPLYVKKYWPLLTEALTALINGHNGDPLLQLSDYYTSRGTNGYQDNSFEALYAVNCLDHDDSIPTQDVPQHYAQFEKASPTFGTIFAYGLSTCSAWPVQSHKVSKAIHAPGAPPIVVVGTTRDPATPLAWAQGLARELDSGVLITRNGDGHTGFHQGNSCVDSAVEDYLIRDVVPKNGLSC